MSSPPEAEAEVLEQAPPLASMDDIDIEFEETLIPLISDIEAQSEKAGYDVEKQQFPSENSIASKENSPLPSPPSPPPPPPPPLPASTSRSKDPQTPKRTHALDNLRAFLVFLLILQESTLETIAHTPSFPSPSSIPSPSHSHPTQSPYPAQYPTQSQYPTHSKSQTLFLTLFITLTRDHIVGALFFVSGLSAVHLMVEKTKEKTKEKVKGSARAFVVDRVFVTLLFVMGMYASMRGVQDFYAPWPVRVRGGRGGIVVGEGRGEVSFYALREGNTVLLTGPIAYVLLNLLFDSCYALIRALKYNFKSNSKAHATRFITTPGRYILALCTAQGVLLLFTTLLAAGFVRLPLPLPLPPLLSESLSILSPLLRLHSMPSAPVQYPLAYLAGVSFPGIHKFVLAKPRGRSSSFSPFSFSFFSFSSLLSSFPLRLFLASSTLFAMYRHFPEPMHRLSNLTSPPGFSMLSNPYADEPLTEKFLPALLYSTWSALSFPLLTTALVRLFFTHPLLRRDWGLPSRVVTHFLPFIRMFFVMGFARFAARVPIPAAHLLVLRCVVVGLSAATSAWVAAMVPYVLLKPLGKVLVLILIALLVVLARVLGMFLFVMWVVGLPTPAWYNRARSDAEVPLSEEGGGSPSTA